MRIQDLILERQRSLFVGRARELRLLQELVTCPADDWHLLHIHGPGGIGKSTLLRLAAERIGPDRAILIDSSCGFGRPEDVLARIGQELAARGAMVSEAADRSAGSVARALNAHAARQGGILLALDAFEKWALVEEWLREEWIPGLDHRVRICTAGRHRLIGPWQAGGWNLLIRYLELPPLSRQEVDEYGRRLGLSDEGVLEDLRRISGGHPLALSLAGPLLVRRGRLGAGCGEARALMQQLMEAVLADVADPLLHRCTEAAAVLLRFDHDLLEATLGEPVPTDRFRALCSLPFVTRCGDCWMLHDSVRQWARADVRVRRPEAYARYRSRAGQAIDRRLAAGPAEQSEWLFDRLYLSESDFMHGLLFGQEDELEVHGLSASDADEVERMYRRLLRATRRSPREERLLALIRPLLAAAPEAFGALRRQGRLMAFGSVFPLTGRTVPILAAHPVTAPVARRYVPGQSRYYLGLAGHDPQGVSGLEALMARDLLRLLPDQGLVLGQLEENGWDRFFRLIGFERAPWLDAASPGGTSYRGYVLDLRTERLHAKVLRRLRAEEGAPERGPVRTAPRQPPAKPGRTPAQPPARQANLTAAALAQRLRRALRHFDRLYARPELVEPLRFLATCAPGEDAADPALQVQEQIRRAIQRLEDGNEAERWDGQILRMAFLERRGSHEQTVERLHLSVPTYYRHLRLAVHRLARELLRAAPG